MRWTNVAAVACALALGCDSQGADVEDADVAAEAPAWLDGGSAPGPEPLELWAAPPGPEQRAVLKEAVSWVNATSDTQCVELVEGEWQGEGDPPRDVIALSYGECEGAFLCTWWTSEDTGARIRVVPHVYDYEVAHELLHALLRDGEHVAGAGVFAERPDGWDAPPELVERLRAACGRMEP